MAAVTSLLSSRRCAISLAAVCILGLVLYPSCRRHYFADLHLKWVAEEGTRRADESMRPLQELFAGARQRVPEFVEAVFSFSSEWAYIHDHFPFTNGGRHAAFLKKAVGEHLFTASQLESTVATATALYLLSQREIENEMLTRLETDVPELPVGRASHLSSGATGSSFADALSQRVSTEANPGGVMVGQQLASLVAAETLKSVSRQLGIGILGVTGVGLIFDFIVMVVTEAAWDACFDPKGKLRRATEDELRKTEAVFAQQLRKSFLEVGAARNVVRRRVIHVALRDSSPVEQYVISRVCDE